MKTKRTPICRQCQEPNNNGGHFCTRKCRMLWIKNHNVKGGKKRAERLFEKMYIPLNRRYYSDE